jgi:hypothetical protein
VETNDVHEQVTFGRLLIVTQQPQINPRDPASDPSVETRGVVPAVVITAGNGHLLGIPDPWVACDDQLFHKSADVPMFYKPGDVVFLDHNARGRALRMFGREIRIVNQIDVLLKLDGVRLVRVDGVWQPESTEEGADEPNA